MTADPVPHATAHPRPSRAVTPPQRLEQASGVPAFHPDRAERSTAHTRPRWQTVWPWLAVAACVAAAFPIAAWIGGGR